VEPDAADLLTDEAIPGVFRHLMAYQVFRTTFGDDVWLTPGDLLARPERGFRVLGRWLRREKVLRFRVDGPSDVTLTYDRPVSFIPISVTVTQTGAIFGAPQP
jgi:hypothetical protein